MEKYGNFQVRQFPLRHVSFCFIVISFTMCVAVVSITQPKLWWNIIKIATRRAYCFQRSTTFEKASQFTSQEKDAEQKNRQEQLILIPWTAKLWICLLDFHVFHFAGTGRGQIKQQKTGLTRAYTELDKINIIDDNVCFLSPYIPSWLLNNRSKQQKC